MRIEAREISQRASFQYLGSMISKDEEIEEDAKHRIRAGWQKWRLASGMLCDWRMPNKIEGKFL